MHSLSWLSFPRCSTSLWKRWRGNKWILFFYSSCLIVGIWTVSLRFECKMLSVFVYLHDKRNIIGRYTSRECAEHYIINSCVSLTGYPGLHKWPADDDWRRRLYLQHWAVSSTIMPHMKTSEVEHCPAAVSAVRAALDRCDTNQEGQPERDLLL